MRIDQIIMAKPAGGPKPKGTSGWDNDWIIISLNFWIFYFFKFKMKKGELKNRRISKKTCKKKRTKKVWTESED